MLAWRRLLVATGLVIPLIWLLVYGFTRDPHIFSLAHWPAGTRLYVDAFDGRSITLKDLRAKWSPQLLGSWCRHAVWKLPLEVGWQTYKDKDVALASISRQRTDARAFIKEFAITYPNRLGCEWEGGSQLWGVGASETFLLDRKGRITYKHVGQIEQGTSIAKINEAMQDRECRGEEWLPVGPLETV